ncbi:MAG: ABC transporter ATP-binding protein [Candidatus Margulisiibacteriota bacterium]|nr:MAG: dipeptide/oligopeptide/nickel ABC transporter ATP-binding protein [Candidatus Margulisbacteria bacterium GWD2_39_127]OGI04653.1 MAG: dipeptide/oligopeptide/nickel ABC transporter ATP-binding protein [Candidatus Margulisbacteria bacterium GWF2_38_17]OGI11815.1 MAG: dipeptide/oligopeptide/nickel ABC transporter ATP-binding protein [Candidatus Margulisbacteria bacterium GWE2_39_32]PZM79815.1 MAG: ABC transporter ATP-binding protein [Candidatus Margulisiibacteriota bacterium]HAR62723.1 hypo
MLEVYDLRVSFKAGKDVVQAVDGVTLKVDKQQIVGIVGESGCGKTVTALSLLKLLPPDSAISGKIVWNGNDILAMAPKELRTIRGSQISMIFQNPVSSLNPVFTIGKQLIDVVLLHRKLSKADAQKEVIKLLHLVKIPAAEKRLNDYPHQFSGGMCQRIMIAMAIAARPDLLIADESTASLDVTIQAQIIELLKELNEELGMSIIMISHDLGVISQMCNYVAIMYLGRIVEYGPIDAVFRNSAHPYTEALLNSIPVTDPSRRKKMEILKGDIPSPINLPDGCRFSGRCKYKQALCITEYPPIRSNNDGHEVACFFPVH